MSLSPHVENASIPKAVSYTHLDVYKRQAQYLYFLFGFKFHCPRNKLPYAIFNILDIRKRKKRDNERVFSAGSLKMGGSSDSDSHDGYLTSEYNSSNSLFSLNTGNSYSSASLDRATLDCQDSVFFLSLIHI